MLSTDFLRAVSRQFAAAASSTELLNTFAMPLLEQQLVDTPAQTISMFNVENNDRGWPRKLIVGATTAEAEAKTGKVFDFRDNVPRSLQRTPPLWAHYPQLGPAGGPDSRKLQLSDAFAAYAAAGLTLVPLVDYENRWLGLVSITWTESFELDETLGAYLSVFSPRISAWLQTEHLQHMTTELQHQLETQPSTEAGDSSSSNDQRLKQIILGQQQDIERLSQSLEEAEIRFQDIANSAPVLIWISDGQGGFRFTNSAFCLYTGQTSENLQEHGWQGLLHPGDEAEFYQAYHAAFSAGDAFQIETRLRAGDVSYRWFHVTAWPRYYPTGELYGYAGTCSDINDKIKKQTDLLATNNALEQTVNQHSEALEAANLELQRMARIKDDFLAGISHEIRTPIANLKLYHALLSTRPDRLDKYVFTLNRETERLSSIVDELIAVADMGRGHVALSFETINLTDLVKGYLKDRRYFTEEHEVLMEFYPESNVPNIRGDLLQLERALGILLSNAVNYTVRGDRIAVYTEIEWHDGQQWVGFAVADNGPGILEEEQKLLFEPFFRGEAGRESMAPGAGLGLAILREIVLQHGGRIELESDGGGTRFNVWFPAYE